MISNFGGRITSSISGKTDFLVVGKEPGFSKVSKARTQPKCQLLSLDQLKNSIESGKSESLENIPPLLVDSFSSGYYGTSTLALEASSRELEIARGLVEPPLQILPGKKTGESSALVKKPKTSKAKTTKPKTTKAPKVKAENISSDIVIVSKKRKVQTDAKPLRKSLRKK